MTNKRKMMRNAVILTLVALLILSLAAAAVSANPRQTRAANIGSRADRSFTGGGSAPGGGDYVSIDAHASTSGGTIDRIVDMSSPFSGGVIKERTIVIGRADIRDSLRMANISPGNNRGDDIDWDKPLFEQFRARRRFAD